MPIEIQAFQKSPRADQIREVLTTVGDEHVSTAEELAQKCGARTWAVLRKRLGSEMMLSLAEWHARRVDCSSHYWGTPKAIEKARKAGMVV